jgi:hypothetical protein
METATPAPAAQTETATPAPVATEASATAAPAADDYVAQAARILAGASETTETPPPETPPAPPIEEVKAEPPKEEPKAEPVSKHLEQIAREKAQLRKEREEWLGQRKAEESRMAKMQRFEEAASTSKLKALRELGIDYEELTNEVLGAPAQAKPEVAPEVAALRKEMEELRAWKQAQEAQVKQTQELQARQGALDAISEYAKASGEKFSRVVALGREADAYTLIDQFHGATGQLPGGSREAALEWALSEVDKQLTVEAEKWRTLLNVSGAPATVAPVVPKPAVTAPREAGQTPRTLSNGLGTAAPTPTEPDNWDRQSLIAQAARVLSGSS